MSGFVRAETSPKLLISPLTQHRRWSAFNFQVPKLGPNTIWLCIAKTVIQGMDSSWTQPAVSECSFSGRWSFKAVKSDRVEAIAVVVVQEPQPRCTALCVSNCSWISSVVAMSTFSTALVYSWLALCGLTKLSTCFSNNDALRVLCTGRGIQVGFEGGALRRKRQAEESC